MSSRPWYPWYPADFRAKTGLLNAAEKGAYRELLDQIYLNRSGIPDDDKKLAKVCLLSSKKWQNVRASLEPFFVIQDGYWYHKTAHEVMTRQKIINQSFSERGKLGALKRWGNKNKQIIDSLANSLAIVDNIARPMANKKLDIDVVVGLSNLHVQTEKQIHRPFLKNSNDKPLNSEQRIAIEAMIAESQSVIQECEKTGKGADIIESERARIEHLKNQLGA